MTKTKIKILEEELEKALQKIQNREETIVADRKKFDRLSDLIKDIWQQEIQQPQHATLSHGPGHNTTTGHISHTSHRGCTSDVFPDKDNTILTSNAILDGVPMPISWIADIADHIKQLKEMNDFQMDEVFQVVNTLHNGKPDQPQGGDPRLWTYQPGAELMTNTSDESGISVNQPQSATDREDIEEQSAENHETHMSGREHQEGEYSGSNEDERNQASSQEAVQRFQDQKEMSFSNRSLERLRRPKDEETTKQATSKRQIWQGRPLSSSQTRKHHGRCHDTRNQSQNFAGMNGRTVNTQRPRS